MALTDRELFKRVFIKRCAAEGLTEEQTLDRIASLMTKQANPVAKFLNWFENSYNNPAKNSKGEVVGGSPIPATLAAGVVAPFAGGAAVGALGSKMTGDMFDEEDAKNDELIRELRRQTELAKQYKRMGGSSPASF